MFNAVLFVLMTQMASPNPVDEAKELYEQGVSFYRTGDFDNAIESFSKAYARSAEPELLFNIAQAYQLRGPSGCEPAARFYNRYLVEVPKAGNRELVKQRLEKMGPCAVVKPPALVEVPAVTPTVGVPQVRAIESPPRPWVGWGPLALSVGGLAASGAGLGIYVWTKIDFDRAATGACHPYCGQTAESLQQRATAAYVFGGVGAAAVAAGIVWGIVLGTAPGDVVVTPTGNGVALGGSF